MANTTKCGRRRLHQLFFSCILKMNNIMTNSCFVKFVPYNIHTLSNLTNKTIKFSTVYEFNDFNELHYLAPPPEIIRNNYEILIKKKLTNIADRIQLIENIKKGNYEKHFISSICEELNNYSSQTDLDPDHLQCLLETIAYSSVGIFCLSGIDIFKDDSAQLMFAHYAENLSGLALIYEIADPTHSINYVSCNEQNKSKSKKPGSIGPTDRIMNWINGIYQDMDDFLNKSSKWQYEKEHRIFGTPGIIQLNNSIKLKAILHTPKLNDTNKQTLHTLNNTIYSKNVSIKEITSSHSNYYFVYSENNEPVFNSK